MLSDCENRVLWNRMRIYVSFLYREDYYNKETEDQHITEVIVAKHRNGPIGTVRLYFKGEYTLFMNLDTRHSELPQ